ncbi:MAG: DUF4254 domain-containing protein [Bacteroidales bacterium]
MEQFSELCNTVFNRCVADYHIYNNVDQSFSDPYPEESFAWHLYKKCWIDCVQWHLEDIIRKPDIDPLEALAIKRRIDRSNQERTDLVEYLDTLLAERYSTVEVREDATLNTETPAWALDRLSILTLKIWHMKIEADREEAPLEHREKAAGRVALLQRQQCELSLAIDTLIKEIEGGTKRVTSYRQMKMYNDPTLNPILYKNR